MRVLLVGSAKPLLILEQEAIYGGISGIAKVGGLKYVQARSTKITEYIFFKLETEAGITTQRTAVYQNTDSNVYSFER